MKFWILVSSDLIARGRHSFFTLLVAAHIILGNVNVYTCDTCRSHIGSKLEKSHYGFESTLIWYQLLNYYTFVNIVEF